MISVVDGLQRSRDPSVERLGAEGFEGIRIAGPGEVSLELPFAIPLTGTRKCGFAENRRFSLEKHAIVAAVDLDTDRLCAGAAFKRQSPLNRRSVPAGSPMPKGMITRQFSMDLARRIPRLPRRQGRYAVSLIVFDRRSNTQVISLVERNRDSEVSRFIERYRDALYPRPVTPPAGSPYPSYGAGKIDGPEPPVENGIRLRLPDRIGGPPGFRAVLQGGFRLPMERRYAVGPRWSRPDPAAAGSVPMVSSGRYGCGGLLREIGRADVGDAQATAVLPITLMITGDDLPGPWLLPIRVPSYDAIGAASSRTPVSGTFAVDLFSIEGMPRIPQGYAVWAFCGTVISNPCLTIFGGSTGLTG